MLNERWRRLRYAKFNVPTRGKIAVSQLCRERHNFFRTASLFSTKLIFDDFCRGISRHQCLAVNESWIRLSVLSSMCQHCSLSAAQRKTKLFPYSILVFWPIVRIKCCMKDGEGWDMLSSMCQYVARLQFLSCAEKDKAFSGQHPCFRRRWFLMIFAEA